ncbi:extracellular solute-binding protein [Elioraea tepida]|jgi:putative spermidine/putrescine transport system substrate-binding protein|uniref:Extracellular solute-binding protein n=1 Tax=Elioraea tepida TaxID=2843330 RepID=A0A975U2Q1_9PROT|nr:extracellular solute-binding protein [Elioraea tepida]QXM25336.1 extracellular solute-binding protein [Elioraea tepida]
MGTEPQGFHEDCIVLAHELHRRGRVDRRTLLAGLAALGVVPAAAGGAQAQGTREIRMVNWGGIANQAFGRFYGEPFMAENPGWTVVQDSSGPSLGRIRSMVESGRVTWDLCDSSSSSSIQLGALNLVNRIDYSIVPRDTVIDPSFTLEFGAAPYSFSSVLVYDKSKFPEPPRSWADFWDLRKFPGTRLLRRDALATLDAAMLSLGRTKENLYPIDVRAALARVRELRRNLIFWNSGSESEQAMRSGEAVMGMIWHTRAKVLHEETQGRITWEWNQGILQQGIFVIPRGNPAGEMAQRLLASMLSKPEPQVGLLQFLGNGPTHKEAAARVPEAFRIFNPTDPANAAKQVVIGAEWWGKNYIATNAEYLDAITG